MRASPLLILTCSVLLWTATLEARAGEPSPCQVHVILFIPSDVRAPTGYQQRIDEMVAYAELFFQREMKRWGHSRSVMPFRRTADRHVEVTLLRGKDKTANYKPVPVRMEVMDELRRRNKLDGPRQVWWILVYPGDPPARFPGYLGGFGPQIGGWAVCNFDTTPGRIDPAAPLGSDFLERITLKGILHELGHGFQLPHVGPLQRDNSGNTLMGPTHINYRRVRPGPEDRVYLSEAEAAMLSVHPAFRGAPDNRAPLPNVEVSDVRYAVRGKTLVVSGRLRSSQRAGYALVGDEAESRPGEYWTKTYAAKVAPDGKFEVIVTEPSESSGTLKLWFAFESGAQTGDGKLRGRESGIARSYTYARQQWMFP